MPLRCHAAAAVTPMLYIRADTSLFVYAADSYAASASPLYAHAAARVKMSVMLRCACDADSAMIAQRLMIDLLPGMFRRQAMPMMDMLIIAAHC